MNWQPIETAPLNETVLVWTHEGIDFGERGENGWTQIYSFRADDRYEPIFPTHWMPLPEPPA